MPAKGDDFPMEPHHAEHAVWQARCAGLLLIGSGIPDRYALTVEAIRAIQSCRLVFVTSALSVDYFKRWCSRVEALSDPNEYGVVVAALKRERPVGLISYGHPLIHNPWRGLVAECRELKIPVSVVSGVSSIDAILSATVTSVDRGVGICTGDLYYFQRVELDRASTLIVYKPLQDEALFGAFIRRCIGVRSKDQPVAFVECGNGETIADTIVWTTLAKVQRHFKKATRNATLLVPPPEEPQLSAASGPLPARRPAPGPRPARR